MLNDFFDMELWQQILIVVLVVGCLIFLCINYRGIRWLVREYRKIRQEEQKRRPVVNHITKPGDTYTDKATILQFEPRSKREFKEKASEIRRETTKIRKGR